MQRDDLEVDVVPVVRRAWVGCPRVAAEYLGGAGERDGEMGDAVEVEVDGDRDARAECGVAGANAVGPVRAWLVQ